MKRRQKKPEQDLLGLILMITFGVFVLAAFAGFSYLLFHRPALTHQVQKGPVPPFYASEAAAQPLPATLEPDKFREQKIQAAYATARHKPAILAQQPCYCGCARQGHRSLLDCFRSDHAAKCSICIREANYARELEARVKCAVDIRNSIIRTDWKSLESSTQ
jgi:uncharacterized membrane protein